MLIPQTKPQGLFRGKKMNSPGVIFTATLLAAAMSFVGPAQAQTQTLVITENPSGSLTFNLNGNPQTFQSTSGSPDFETWEISVGQNTLSGGALWREPGESPWF